MFNYVLWQVGLDGQGVGRDIILKTNDHPVLGRQRQGDSCEFKATLL